MTRRILFYVFYFRQSPFNRSRPPSATASISISQKRLRPTDPVSQLLDIVHKIIYISCVNLLKKTKSKYTITSSSFQ